MSDEDVDGTIAEPPEWRADQPAAVLSREVAAVPAQATVVRTVLGEWGRDQGIPPGLVQDVQLAAYEALANAVTHAYSDKSKRPTMSLTAVADQQAVDVTVADGGQWRDRNSSPYGGRGLTLIRALADTVTLTTSKQGTSVRMSWSLTENQETTS